MKITISYLSYHTKVIYFKDLLSVNHIMLVKKLNKLCCIVICHCELKLKFISIVFVRRQHKSY